MAYDLKILKADGVWLKIFKVDYDLKILRRMACDLKIFKADGVWLKNIQGGWRITYEYSRRMAYDLKILRRMAYDLKIFKADGMAY